MIEINLGIVADGATDHKIFEKIVQCISSGNHSELVCYNTIPLNRKSIHDPVQRYLSLARKNQEYYLPSKTAEKLRDEIVAILNSAFSEFTDNADVSSRDLLLLTTDSEHTLENKDHYLGTWAYALTHIFIAAIDKFYNFQANCYYPRQSLPRVIPLATFPSTEILVAGARNLLGKHLKPYGKKPQELKQLLYNTNTEAPTEEELEEHALRHITLETIEHIFRDVPESRMFLQALSTGFQPCIAGDPSLCRQTENGTD